MDAVIKWLMIYGVVMSSLTFFVCAMDKAKARKKKWRIPERTLFLLAAMGGSLGLWLGMYVFRHKVAYRRFSIGVPTILMAQCLLAWVLARGW